MGQALAKSTANVDNGEIVTTEQKSTGTILELPTVDRIDLPEKIEEKLSPFRKYEARERKRIAAGSPVSLNWDYADRIFLPGTHPPRRETTVAGKLYLIVKRAGPEGISGRDLVFQALELDFSRNPSHFTQGKPPVSWIEDYITGMLRVRYSHLSLKSR